MAGADILANLVSARSISSFAKTFLENRIKPLITSSSRTEVTKAETARVRCHVLRKINGTLCTLVSVATADSDEKSQNSFISDKSV